MNRDIHSASLERVLLLVTKKFAELCANYLVTNNKSFGRGN